MKVKGDSITEKIVAVVVDLVVMLFRSITKSMFWFVCLMFGVVPVLFEIRKSNDQHRGMELLNSGRTTPKDENR